MTTVDRQASDSLLTPRLLVVIAAALGFNSANLYYAQPLLHTIGDRFGASEGTTGLIITASQIGYALGLALLVPAGDLFDRKKLVPALLGGAAVLMLISAAAPNLWVLVGLAGLMGVCVVSSQILVPLVASLADDGRRGKAVGTVMTGLLLGILLARTLSGAIAGIAGWRTVYVVAFVITAGFAVLLRRELPEEQPRPHQSYRDVLRSTVHLARTEPALRRAAAIGGFLFAGFSVLWTTLAFRLSTAPFDYGDSTIGLLGLVGAAGALAASGAGRLADRGHARVGRIVAGLLVGGSFGVLWIGRDSIVVLIVGILLLDVGVQLGHILNQSTIYEIAPSARSRINSVYMTTYFVGGAIGSSVGSLLYDRSGWGSVCVFGAFLGAGAAISAVCGPSASPGGQRGRVDALRSAR